MHHPHIVQTRAIIETADWIFIVMELMEGGELQRRIEAVGTYAEADAAEVMLRLAVTLGFLHSQGASPRSVLRRKWMSSEKKNSLSSRNRAP